MTFIERILRAMTHLNIGATIATAVWILWSGLVVVDPSNAALRAKPAPMAAPARPVYLDVRQEERDHQSRACPCGKPPLTTRTPSPDSTTSIRVDDRAA